MSAARCLLVASFLAVMPCTVHALHKVTPGAGRLSQGLPDVHPGTRSWGYFFAFSSAEDLAATANTTQQIFMFSLFAYDCLYGIPGPELGSCPSSPAPYVQVTTGPGAPDNPSAADMGRLVAFDADGAYAGGSGPGVGHRQIFLKDLSTNQVRRVTDSANGDSVRPALTERGGYLVFESTAALLGGPVGVSQIYAYDVNAGILQRMTNGAGPSTEPSPNKLGRVVAFTSRADLLGDGHDTGVEQIFWFERVSGRIHQLTNGNGPSRHTRVTSRLSSRTTRLRGAAIVFESEATDLPGASGVPGPQVYASGTAIGDLPPIVRLTPPAVAGCSPPSAGVATVPALDPSGGRIAFVSTGDLLCNGTSGRRVFLLDIKRPTLYQITGRGDVEGPIGASLGRWFLTFATTDDVTGSGVCGHQLHVVDYFKGHWAAATAVNTIPLEPTPGNAAAGCADGDVCTTDACGVGDLCEHTPIPGCP